MAEYVRIHQIVIAEAGALMHSWARPSCLQLRSLRRSLRSHPEGRERRQFRALTFVAAKLFVFLHKNENGKSIAHIIIYN